MLHDTMKTVKQAEKEAKKMVEDAKEKAAEIIEAAREKAAGMKEAAKTDCQKQADQALDAAKKEESAKSASFAASLEQDVSAGKQKAAKKEAEVVKAVLAAV